MAQLSRPFQVALAAVCLLAAVWFVALRGHSSSGGGPAPRPAAPASQPPASSSPHHGSAPGVAGLTRAIEKAHGAVAESERNAKQLQQKSEQASSPSAASGVSGGSTSTPAPSPSASARAGASATHAARSHAAPSHAHARTHQATKATGQGRIPARQALVEGVLKQGYTVAVLFLNPHASDDVFVAHQLRALLAVQRRALPAPLQALLKAFGRELGDSTVVLEPRGSEEKLALMTASAGQVADFGSFTRVAQVYQTPTLLLVNQHKQIATLTGLTDAYSIEQALDEPHP